jgi:two-component system response regulator (stage 0 sporulation protein A)
MTKQETCNKEGQIEDTPMFWRLCEIIHELGITSEYRGYFYLRDATLMVMEGNISERILLKDVYSAIAVKYGMSASGVDCGIRNAIEAAWLRGRMLRRKDSFSGGIKPTNSQLIFYLSNFLKKTPRSK